jgi:hypothetical protein
VPLLTIGGSFSKSSAPPFFLEDENIFQKPASMVVSEIAIPGRITTMVHGARFLKKKFSSSRKRGGADFFPGFVWWVV